MRYYDTRMPSEMRLSDGDDDDVDDRTAAERNVYTDY